ASLTYTIPANPDAMGRTATLVVGGRVVTIVQASAPHTCTFETWPVGWVAPGSGGTFSFSVHQVGGCAWYTAMDVPGPTWIQVSGNSGNVAVDGTVSYTLDANPDTQNRRSATIHIGAGSPGTGSVDYTVTQDASAGSGGSGGGGGGGGGGE